MSRRENSRAGLGLRGATAPARRLGACGIAVCLALAIGVLSVGCMQILGLEDRKAASDAGVTTNTGVGGGSSVTQGQCGGLSHASATCASCMDRSCCNEAKDCAGDPACQQASTCLAGCIDDACRARCGVFYSQPESLITLRSCRISLCAAACNSSCGEYESTIPSCQACRTSTCCAEGTACAANPLCAALDACRASCVDKTSCPSDCDRNNPQGKTDYNPWLACGDQCASACQGGQSWDCLNSAVFWPKPKAVGTVTFSVIFEDFGTARPFVGATVKACSKIDLSCASPSDMKLTDGTGLVSLTVPVGLAGFDGYLDISGGKIDGTGSASYPALLYLFPFIISDGFKGRDQILSVDGLPMFAAAVGADLDPTRGHFAANAADCNFTLTPGVQFIAESADDNTKSFYTVDGVPSPGPSATDGSAVGGFLNLPAKLSLIRAISIAAGGKTVGSYSFIIRPGTITTTTLYPPLP